MKPSTADETRDTLAHALAGAIGGTPEHWASLIRIETQPVIRNIQCNWWVVATGTADERFAIEECARLLAKEQRYAVG